MIVYTFRYWFEHGGGCLWGADEHTKERFGYKADYTRLPLSDALTEQLRALEKEYATYLNWDDPAAPSPWSDDQKQAFLEKANGAYAALCRELGDDVVIKNEVALSLSR